MLLLLVPGLHDENHCYITNTQTNASLKAHLAQDERNLNVMSLHLHQFNLQLGGGGGKGRLMFVNFFFLFHSLKRKLWTHTLNYLR